MPWKVTDIMEERIRFVIRAESQQTDFSSLCREFGISRTTGYRWWQRFSETGSITSLHERSRRPHRSPSKTTLEDERCVAGLRKRYGWGGKKLKVLLERKRVFLTLTTINRILKRNGLINRKDSHSPATRRFEREHPNELWQMDFKGDFNMRRGRCYPLSILDDHSRFTVGLFALTGTGGKGVNRCLIKTFKEYGVPEAILLDHGSPWWGASNGHGLTWLSVSLLKQDIRLYWSGVRHPQTQGKVERFHRTLKHDVLHHSRPLTLGEWEQALQKFRYEYNYIRPHEALDMLVPNERYQASLKPYNPDPLEWEYSEGSIVNRLNTQGCLDYQQRRYFVCEALAKERVKIEQVRNRLIVRYRHMYIREIELETGKTIPIVRPVSKNAL